MNVKWNLVAWCVATLGCFVAFAPGCGLTQGERQESAKALASGPVVVELQTTKGAIVVELDQERAPITVANFLGYVDRGAYDGTIFHRVIASFVVQGGGYTVDFTERKGGDPIVNEWQNGLKNVRGTIAMARDADPDTARNEFYFNVVDNGKLDTARAKTGNAGYAVFGRVVAGMEVLDSIRVAPTSARPEKDMLDVPVEPVVLIRAERAVPISAK